MSADWFLWYHNVDYSDWKHSEITIIMIILMIIIISSDLIWWLKYANALNLLQWVKVYITKHKKTYTFVCLKKKK